MSNDKLVEYVQDELFWDPKVDNVAIAVSADDGKITLRGTVGSLREKLEAKKAAKRVVGVKSVDNELEVKFMNDEKRDDADLRGDVLQALMLNSFVPSTIDARVDDGFVTLTGTADWQYQRDEAVYVASSVAGAVNIFDDITLKPQPSAGDVKDRIEDCVRAERQARRQAPLGLDFERHGHDQGRRELVGRARRGGSCRLVGSGSHQGRRPDRRRVLEKPERVRRGPLRHAPHAHASRG
jgi:osmotically-inducible protein OsmY